MAYPAEPAQYEAGYFARDLDGEQEEFIGAQVSGSNGHMPLGWTQSHETVGS